MKISSLLFIILFFPVIQIIAQNNTPEVTNVAFSQQTGGSFLVDVYYDVYDADNDPMFVTMQVSEDSGYTWDFPCDSINGDVGAGILSGTGKHILWDFGAEHPDTSGDAFRVKIIAEDGDTLGSVTDIDGNVYQTVKIGNQWWMAENLKVTHYSNGDTIPNLPSGTEWLNTTNGAWCAYQNNISNIETYGLLYNWYAIGDPRNLSPQGMHVPTENEWQELEIYLGMDSLQVILSGWRGTDEGGKLKETGTTHWISPNTGATNSSGFTGLPGGYRLGPGTFLDLGIFGCWWSSTAYSSTFYWGRNLRNTYAQIYRQNYHITTGYSVRCVGAYLGYGISDVGSLTSIIPVELTSFTASVIGNEVELLWWTATETNNSGFDIERKFENSEFSKIGFVPGFGTTTETKSYSFTDAGLQPGVYSYHLKQVDFNGTFEYSYEINVQVNAPSTFSLDQNYPNPFNPSTTITFSLAIDSKVNLKVFDVLGQEVTTLVNEQLTAGIHNYNFNAAGLNSGIYFYKIQANDVNGNQFTDIKKMILLK